MKKLLHLISLLMALLLFICSSSAENISEETQTDKAAFIEANEERALNAFKLFCRYLSDDIDVYSTARAFEKESEAWKMLRDFDGGWFSASDKRTFENLRTDKWEIVSDTEFCVDVYGDYTMRVTAANKYITYSAAWHFCFRQTDADKNLWHVYDFHILENAADKPRAGKFTLENDGITMETVIGKTFTGYLMIVDDPSRVFVGGIKRFDVKTGGIQIHDLVEQFDALGGINGGGFSEASGGSSSPSGLVISMGELRRRHSSGSPSTGIVMGFDENDKLVVGSFKREEIDQLNLRDALAFGPALIIDGEAVDTGNERADLSIRTAIGQDKDGRVLMLVTRGRQPDSLGANMKDLIEIMLSYGAVNAGNLDGGNSTCMYLNGESVYSGFRLETSRKIPAGFLIKKLPTE